MKKPYPDFNPINYLWITEGSSFEKLVSTLSLN